MAKTYAAELLIKNKNAINSLEQVQKKVKSLQKELKKPIEVDAKLGSGFKNIESKINKIAPKTKTIRIEATEDVTKTMNNVQREMFEMTEKLNSSLSTSMKGFSDSFTPAIKGMENLVKAAEAIRESMSFKNSYGNNPLGIPPVYLPLQGKGKANVKTQDLAKKKSFSFKWLKPAVGDAFVSGIKDGYRKWKGLHASYAESLQQELGTSALVSFDSHLGKLINKQKAAMGKLYGSEYGSLYLKDRYFRLPTKINEDGSRAKGNVDAYRSIGMMNFDSFRLGVKGGRSGFTMPEGIEVDKFMKYGEKVGKVMLKVDNLKKSLENMKLIKGPTKLFNSMAQAVGTLFTKVETKIAMTMAKTVLNSRKMFFAIQRGAYHLGAITFPLIKPFASAFKYIKTSATSTFNQIRKNGASSFSRMGSYIIRSFSNTFSFFNRLGSKITTTLKNAFTKVKIGADGVATKIVRPWVSAATKIASSITKKIGNAFKKIGSIASTAAKAVATAFGGAVAFGVKDMATQEQYVTSMTHFISVDDAKRNGKNTITTAQAQQRAEGLFDWGTEFANSTPFQNSEVYSAINRMTQVFGYGTDGAQIQKMVKLVGDMAALNPGKTMSDAAEAIADLAVGETERMKEFGLKLTQDDLKALAGVPGQKDSLSQEQILKAFSEMTESGGVLYETFDGGADAMANTLSGKFSTVMGKFRQMMVDSMKPFEDIFKGVLDKVIKALSGGFRDNFVNTFSTIASFIGDLMAGDSSNFPVIENLKNAFNTLKDVLGPIFSNIINGWKQIFEAISQRFGGIGGIIEGVANVIANVINGLSPVFNIVGQVVKTFGNIIAQVWPSIQDTIVNVWTNLKPVFELFGNLAQGIADIFTFVWPGIAGVIETLWGTIGPIFEGIAKVLGTIADLANKAFDGIKKVKESKLNPANWFGGDSKQNAYGKNRVPYDGYQASLHEGERILTSRQAAQMDAGLLPGQSGGNNNNITINVSGTTDPDTTARMVVQRLKETLENTSVKSFA